MDRDELIWVKTLPEGKRYAHWDLIYREITVAELQEAGDRAILWVIPNGETIFFDQDWYINNDESEMIPMIENEEFRTETTLRFMERKFQEHLSEIGRTVNLVSPLKELPFESLSVKSLCEMLVPLLRTSEIPDIMVKLDSILENRNPR